MLYFQNFGGNSCFIPGLHPVCNAAVPSLSRRYKVISYSLSKPVDPTPTNCVQILMQAGLEKWALGHTKVSSF